MTYDLVEETLVNNKLTRLYRNKAGAETKTSLIYTDKDGRKWFGFVDLFRIPVIRISMAQHISSLYGVGLSSKDLATWIKEEKALLKSNDPEKYEKLYAMILEKERIINYTADPVKQHLALCTVYVIAEDERIDYFDESIADEKLKLWLGMPEGVGFFLSWHNEHIQNYMKDLNEISKTVSKLEALQKKNQPLPQ